MRKRISVKEVLKVILIAYIALSLGISIWYNVDVQNSWDIATHRYGLLIIGVSAECLWILSPFCNWGDVFIFGIHFDDGRIFTDGLYEFGQWNVT